MVSGAGDATGQHEVALHRGSVDVQARCLFPQHHRRRSPSYRRRLIRRAAARAAAADTVTAVKFVQTEAENLPNSDQVLPCMLAVEAEQQPQHYLPQDEVCSDESYAELCLATTLPQLDGHNDNHVLNHSKTNILEFIDIIKKQENDRRRYAANARKEREAEREEDMRKFRKMLDLHR